MEFVKYWNFCKHVCGVAMLSTVYLGAKAVLPKGPTYPVSGCDIVDTQFPHDLGY